MDLFKTLVVPAVLAFTAPGAGQAATEALPEPEGRVVLTVSGSIANTNNGPSAEFDMSMLKDIGIESIETHTPWTEGATRFEGVPIRDVLRMAGATGRTVDAVALNDYRFRLPIADFERYKVLLAFRMNGQRLRIRDKGPLWVIYPMDQHPELRNESTHNKMVWQLRELVVH